MLESVPEYQRDARKNGTPTLGRGKIYPVPEADFVVPDFPLPDHWVRAYGLDVGWQRTAAVWIALDRDTDIAYFYSEHYAGNAIPGSARGGDQGARGMDSGGSRSGRGGLFADRRAEADGAVPGLRPRHRGGRQLGEAGIYAIWQRLAAGKLKVFASLSNWLAEYKLYRRDDKGHVVKEKDHCFHPDTLVVTEQGRVPVRELVGKIGRVQSRGGSWAHFYGARLTAKNARVVRLRFDDDCEIVCTPDHQYLTPRGWERAIDLEGKTVYDGVSQCVHRNEFWEKLKDGAFHSLFQRRASCSKAIATICADAIFSSARAVSGCIAGFGKFGTADDVYLEGTTFITRTTAALTIGRRTLNSWRKGSTRDIITQGARRALRSSNTSSGAMARIASRKKVAPRAVRANESALPAQTRCMRALQTRVSRNTHA